MKGPVKIIALVAAFLVGVPIILAAALVGAANTGWGMQRVAWLVSTMTGGQLVVTALSGRFPDRLRIGHGEIRDQEGAWVTFDEAALDWSPLQLLQGDVRIESLTAAHLVVRRRPKEQAGSRGSAFPGRIDIAHWQIGRLELAAPLARLPAALTIEGAAHLTASGGLRGTATARRLDGQGDYHIDAAADAQGVTAHLTISEPEHGLIAELANLPELGPLAVAANLDGPIAGERLNLTGTAGPLQAAAKGTINIPGKTADLDATLHAPAMHPRADLGWEAIAATLTIHGGFAKPDVTGKIHIDRPTIAGISAGTVDLAAQGNAGAVRVTGSIAAITVPGPSPDLFAATPVQVTVSARLDGPTPSLDCSIGHPLVAATGNAEIDRAGTVKGSASLTLPSLAPFSGLAGIDLSGSGKIDTAFSRTPAAAKMTATGGVAFTGGQSAIARLIGEQGQLQLAATLADDTITIEQAGFTGSAFSASASGSDRDGALDLAWNIALPDVSRVSSSLRGQLGAQGRLSGAMPNLSVAATLNGALGTDRVAKGAIAATVDAHGLPAAPEGKATIKGVVAGSPLQLVVTGRRDASQALRVTIDSARWKNAVAQGDVTLPAGTTSPEGKIGLRLNLADFSALANQPLAGKIDAALDLHTQSGKAQLRVSAQGQGIAGANAKLAQVKIDGTIADLAAHAPAASLHAVLRGIDAGAATGDADLTATGPLTALALKLSSEWRQADTQTAPARLTAAASLDMPARRLRIAAFAFSARGQEARLLAPAQIDFANGLAVDRLRIGSAQAVLQIAGRLTPKLDVTASLSNVTPQLAKPFLPGMNGTGTLRADARLTGTFAAPQGVVHVAGRGLSLHSIAVPFPVASFDATAQLQGTAAQLEATFTAGKLVGLTAAGRIPLAPSGSIDVKSKGHVDLRLLDPILAAAGRSVHGTLTLDAAVTGTVAAPRIDGSATLAKGEAQDYVQGLHITGIAATLKAENGIVRLVDVTGHAGPGTISATGTIDLTRPALPVDLHIDAKRAKPLQSDLLTADVDAALTVRGEAMGKLDIDGNIRVHRADINIPEKFPQTVAVLNVRRPGRASAPAPTTPRFAPNLSITLNAPEQVFVRGHGLDAELGGKMAIGGSIESPVVTGALSLRRGTFDLVGQTLTFTSGTLTFDPTGLSKKIDPALNFAAQSTSGNVSATLTVTGYADAPVIALTSSPQMPADQIMSQLLFGQNVTQLSALQAASVAQGLASLGGIGGSGSTLGDIRKTLGLDRLSVGSDTRGTGAAVEAGRYVARGVYVGAKQGISGGTQAQVQVDITKHLKAQTVLGTGNGAPVTGITPQNDPGSSVGLTYQFEY